MNAWIEGRISASWNVGWNSFVICCSSFAYYFGWFANFSINNLATTCSKDKDRRIVLFLGGRFDSYGLPYKMRVLILGRCRMVQISRVFLEDPSLWSRKHVKSDIALFALYPRPMGNFDILMRYIVDRKTI